MVAALSFLNIEADSGCLTATGTGRFVFADTLAKWLYAIRLRDSLASLARGSSPAALSLQLGKRCIALRCWAAFDGRAFVPSGSFVKARQFVF